MSSLRSQYRHSELQVQVQPHAVQDAGCVLLRSLPTPWLTPRLILEDPRQLLGFPATRSPQDFLSILSVSWISIAWICMIWYNCSCVISFHIDKRVPRERGCKVEKDSSAQQPWTCGVLYLSETCQPFVNCRPVSWWSLPPRGKQRCVCLQTTQPAHRTRPPPTIFSAYNWPSLMTTRGALRPKSLQWRPWADPLPYRWLQRTRGLS